MHVLITAGPTREPWDPIRFFSNASFGLMGIALAEAAARSGARVTLVLGPTPLRPKDPRVKTIRVSTARQMLTAVRHSLPADVFIGSAAVTDYRPARVMAQKCKWDGGPITIRLVPNPDILKTISLLPDVRRPRQVVGFALETEQVMVNAMKKLKRKRLDAIVANDQRNIGGETGSATLVWADGRQVRLKRMLKIKLAEKIWKELHGR